MAEGVGFEPTVALPLRLISSQVPLTTQPPFHSFICNNLKTFEQLLFDNMILKSDTAHVKRNRKQTSAAKPGKVWQKTQYANLLRYVPSGTYFARIRVGGKLIRRSLESTVLSRAKLKLADLDKEERARLENHQQFASGKATFNNLLTEYRTRLEANHSIKPRTRAYYNERIEAMLKNWPDLRHCDVTKLKPEDAERSSATYVN